MSYQSLARKYRPKRFSDLVGQEAVTRALCNAIKIKREPSAVIFSGVRGIGKTTAARLYAKALNCQQHESEACDSCESCQAIDSGRHEDVLEIDGASHNGVDEIRLLQETVGYLPQRSQFKVYIIDEVHMLSTSAFNALLKTLEEPPPHVIFVFATTELHKVPQTVIGRCQTFHLQKLSLKDTFDRMVQILNHEGIDFEDRALQLVAREGAGSMRDALTFLDQVIALSHGRVDLASLSSIISNGSSAKYLKLLEALVGREASVVLDTIAELDQSGLDFSEVCAELLALCRHGFLVKDLGVGSLDISLLALDESEVRDLERIANKSEVFDLNRMFRSFLKCKKDMEGSDVDRFTFENYCLEWCLDSGLPEVEQLLKLFSSTTSEASAVLSHINTTEYRPSVGKEQTSKQERSKRVSLKDSLLQGREDKKPAPTNPEKKNFEPPTPPLKPVEEQKSQELQDDSESLPVSWVAFVDFWKKLKPIEARKLEELHPVAYDAQHIKLGVKDKKYWNAVVSDPSFKRSFIDSYLSRFMFSGSLEFVDLDENAPESILQTKTREKDERKRTVEEHARHHPLTLALLDDFSGVIIALKHKSEE